MEAQGKEVGVARERSGWVFGVVAEDETSVGGGAPQGRRDWACIRLWSCQMRPPQLPLLALTPPPPPNPAAEARLKVSVGLGPGSQKVFHFLGKVPDLFVSKRKRRETKRETEGGRQAGRDTDKEINQSPRQPDGGQSLFRHPQQAPGPSHYPPRPLGQV